MYKKINYLLFLLCLYMYPSTSLAISKANSAAEAKKILACLEVPDSFQADFTYTNKQKGDKESQQVQGKVWVKGNKYRIVLDEQLVINDGETIWNYLTELNEVHINKFEPAEVAELFSPIQLLKMHQRGFIPITLQQTSINELNYDILELVAIDKESFITHLNLTIEQKNHQIKKIEAWDNNGTEHSFMLTYLVTNIKIEDSYFKFDTTKYKEVEIIDLR